MSKLQVGYRGHFNREALVEQRFDETKAAKYSILIRTRTA